MIVAVLGLIALVTSTLACPYKCKCSEDTVDCTRQNLSTFPTNIPLSTRVLRLGHNKLTILPPNPLSYLTKLEELYAGNNKINVLYSDTFRENRMLQILHLGHNKIQELPYNLFTNQRLLNTLYVEQNQLASLPSQLFKNNPYISSLSLENNPSLRVVPLSVITIPSLTKMTVDSIDCQCSTLTVANLLISQHKYNIKMSCGAPEALKGLDIKVLYRSLYNDCQENSNEEVKCSQDEFQCTDGQCIDITWRCDIDKIKDCNDGSDETNCEVSCGFEEFQCDSGDCIELGLQCDGNFDCRDFSDEVDCITTVLPYTEECEYECDNKQKCLSRTWLCDGHTDCSDGSDEVQCPDSVSTVCGEGQFECYTNKRCINTTQMCNGVNECGDGSEESKFLCRGDRFDDLGKVPCPAGQVMCTNGECVWHNWICNGKYECSDHSDEMNCYAEECNGTKAACDNGRCINLEWFCDGTNDCGDNSDEINCAIECKDNEIRCGTGECLHCKWSCDGYKDCADGSDEAVCPVKCTGSECGIEAASVKVFTIANIVMIVSCSVVILLSASIILIIFKCRSKRSSSSPRPPRYNEIDCTAQQIMTLNQSNIPSSPPPRYKSQPDLNSDIATRLISGVTIEISPQSLHGNNTSVVSLSSSSEESEL